MSVSSVTSGSATQFQAQSSTSAGVKGDLRQLIQAIKSGDLTAAQSAYDSLYAQLQQSNNSSTSTSSDSSSAANASTNPFQQFLQQVGAALDKNDIQGAQQALSGLQQTKAGHHHHHPGAGDATDQATTTTSTSTTTTTSVSATTGVNVVV
jgi:CCR4-NOT transcriptional regulation complex NOT5 subunit